MFAMKIQMDEEKILREDVINLVKVYKALDDIFAERGFHLEYVEPDKTRYYCGTEIPDDYAHSMVICFDLEAQDWFKPNCKKWLWGDNEDVSDDWSWSDMLNDDEDR